MVTVSEIMFASTVASIYMSYVYWLGTTGPRKAIQLIRASKEGHAPRGSAKAMPLDEVMRRIEQKRYGVWIAGTSMSSVCSESYCTFLILSCLISGGSFASDIFSTFHFWTAFASACSTRWASKPGRQMSSREMMILTSLINFYGLVNSIDLSNHLMCANYLGRVFAGSIAPDIGFTVKMNMYMIPVAVACGCIRQGSALNPLVLSELILNEVISVTFVAVVLGQLSYLNIKQEQSNMELEENVKKQDLHIKETETLLNAAKSLLAVMCDCCEQLSHDWKIVQPSNKVLEMFRFPNMRKERPEHFDLVQCIAVQDQDRFTNFIATSHVNAPSSLHLQMKDFNGRLFDVQLFHMPVPRLLTEEEPEHLVGIICHNSCTEPRPARGRTAIIPIPEGAMLNEEEVAAASSSSDDISVFSKGSQRLRNLVEDNMSTPGFLTDPMQYLDLIDSVKLNVDLHTSNKGYVLRKLLFTFKDVPVAEDGLKLFTFLKRRYRVLIEDWLQEHVNSWYHGVHCDEKCLGTKLSLSGLGSVLVGEMSVLNIWSDEEQFSLDLEMKNFVGK